MAALRKWRPLAEAGSLVNLQHAGGSHVTVYGYVATGYGGQPLNDMKDEIDRYQTLYPNLVDGIFLDEMSNLQSKLADYHMLYEYIKTGTPASSYKGGPVIGNPGTQTVAAYLLPATHLAPPRHRSYGSHRLWLAAPPAGGVGATPAHAETLWSSGHPSQRWHGP